LSLWTLILRGLVYRRRSNLAVVLGAAVGVAVITGSLLVGDSVRGSLRRLAEERLGRTDFALQSPRFFAAQTADALAAQAGADLPIQCVPLIALDGAAIDPESELTVPGVAVLGVDGRFWQLSQASADVPLEGRTVAVNRAMAEAMDLRVGQRVLLRVPRATTGRSASLFGRRQIDDTVQEFSVAVGRIIDESDLGRFSLRSDRPRPRNVYVSLPWLADQLGAKDKVNTLLVASGESAADPRDEAASLTALFGRAATLDDYGLRLVRNDARGYWSLESTDMVLSPQVVEAARRAAAKAGLLAEPASVYLANELSIATKVDGSLPAGRSVPYSIVAAVDLAAGAPLGPMTAAGGTKLPTKLAPGEMLLNDWAARELGGATVGDTVAMTHYRVRRDGTLDVARHHEFVVRGIVSLEGPARDPGLVPEFPGVTDADNLSGWNPPFRVDQNKILDQDEQYWRDYRATPKAFVSFDDARELWRPELAPAASDDAAAAWPWVTSLRMTAADTVAAPSREEVERCILNAIAPPSVGLALRPVKAQALAASGGSTDFASLLLGLSFFLVVAAALLVALLMRLAVERRAGEIGTLLALGMRPAMALRLVLLEGLILSLVAVIVGVPLGAVYARGILLALATLWVGALGPFSLSFHATAASLIGGGAAGLIVSMIAVGWAARMLRRTTPLVLLGGWRTVAMEHVASRRTRGFAREAVVLALAAAGLVAARLFVASVEVQFFLIGSLVLVAGLAATSMLVHRQNRSKRVSLSISRLALRGASRSPLRSLLTVGLTAAASFAIVAVAANRVDLAVAPVTEQASGAGGFTFVARSELPLLLDPGTPEGRAALGFTEKEESLLARATIVSCRVRGGDDASCLNLQQPASPRVVGVPASLVGRGGFSFAGSLAGEGQANPWTLLNAPAVQETGQAVAAFGDEASVSYILKSKLGGEVAVTADSGEAVPLRIVGLFKGSLWQSDLVISEREFVRHFGADGGYRLFLIEAAPADAEAARRVLVQRLGDRVGLDVRPTGDVLAEYAGVQNAYLSTFQMLGGLGLVLGTFAVVAVLLRNIVERRGELGMMLALGLRRRWIVSMVTLESLWLIVVGLTVGVASALVAVGPRLRQAGADVPWLSLGLTLAAIVAVGLVACRAAAGRAVGRELLDAVRAE
jgi:ABC-type antimicrobial peptide transport system permease subunit